MTKSKIIVVGIDGGDLDIINQIDNLPNLRNVIDRGVHGYLDTTIPPLTPCAWSSFMTGKNPGKHGIYDFLYLDAELKMRINSSMTRKGEDLWEILGRHGLRCLVFNVPFTYPPRSINGIMVSGFTTPSVNSNFTFPLDVKEEILRKHPDFRFSEKSKYSPAKKHARRFAEDTFRLCDERFEIFTDLMGKDDFDFSMLVFMLTDHIQHWYWRYYDEKHPKYVQDKDFSNMIPRAYQKVDSYLGKLIDSYPRHDFILMSDHGCGPKYMDVTLNKWLMDHGYLFTGHQKTPKSITRKIGLDRLIRKGLSLGLWEPVRKFQILRRAIYNHIIFTYNDIDWNRTVAYSFGYYGPIYLKRNIPELEKERIIGEIASGLSKLRDPLHGGPLVNKIWKKQDLYHGDEIDALPDIVLNMGNFSYACSSTFPFASSDIFSDPKTFSTGDHTTKGLFAAYGPEIQEARSLRAHIQDIASTLLHKFGIDVPPDMDGKILDIWKI